MNTTQADVLQLLISSLWQTPLSTPIENWEVAFGQLKAHAVASLAGNCLKHWPMPQQLMNQWKQLIYQQIVQYSKMSALQNALLACFDQQEVPVVVVKGTTAAAYYPMPELRTMGDIDLLVRPQDYDKAKKIMEENGWQANNEGNNRHCAYYRQHIVVELHRRFAADRLSNATQVDQLLFNKMTIGKHELDNDLNGLVLLMHIAHHLPAGLGLRQIIDWMMFVNQYVDDEFWHVKFQPLAEMVGLERLAKSLTRMCQLYIGLNKQVTWCINEDEDLCTLLLDYIFECGNFGNKRNKVNASVWMSIPTIWHPIKLFQHLQQHGENNWNALQRFSWLKPFAWLSQLWRSVAIFRKSNVKLKDIKKGAYRQQLLLDQLELPHDS